MSLLCKFSVMAWNNDWVIEMIKNALFTFLLLYFLYIGRIKTYCDIISDALTIS